MLSFLTAIGGKILGSVAKSVLGIVDDMVEDKDLAAKLKTAIHTTILQHDLTKFVKQIEAQKSVIIAEMQGQSWLQRSWRPALMCLFGLIIFNNYVLYPYLSLFFVDAPMLEVPTDMWGLLKLGVSGYVVGRSVEKISSAEGLSGVAKKMLGGK